MKREDEFYKIADILSLRCTKHVIKFSSKAPVLGWGIINNMICKHRLVAGTIDGYEDFEYTIDYEDISELIELLINFIKNPPQKDKIKLQYWVRYRSKMKYIMLPDIGELFESRAEAKKYYKTLFIQ